MVRPRSFSLPRRFGPQEAVAGLFHPTATCEIPFSGVFPAAKPTCLIDKSCPHVVSDFLLLTTEVFSTGSSRPAFRAFIRATVRDHRQSS